MIVNSFGFGGSIVLMSIFLTSTLCYGQAPNSLGQFQDTIKNSQVAQQSEYRDSTGRSIGLPFLGSSKHEDLVKKTEVPQYKPNGNVPNSSLSGSIQGGGGGVFSVSLFWHYVDQIKSVLNESNFTRAMTEREYEKLKLLMNPTMVQLIVQKHQLFVKDEGGADKPVDAVNIPGKKTIVLFEPAWNSHFASGLEIRHLILHEFLGLAEIDDSGYKVSSKYFFPSLRPIPFKWNNLSCSVSGYFLYHSVDYYQIIYANTALGDELEVVKSFPEPKLVGKVQSFCQDLNDHSENCNHRDMRRPTKKLTLMPEFKFQKDFWAVQPVLPRIFAKIDVIFGGDFQSYGWGAAAQKTFSQNADVSFIGQIVSMDKSGKKTIIAVELDRLYGMDKSGKVSSGLHLINPEILNLLINAGIDLQPAMKSTAGVHLLSAQNISDLFSDYARSMGARSEKESDRILSKNIFKDLQPVVPVYVDVLCSIGE
jgi:hypothetical protein